MATKKKNTAIGIRILGIVLSGSGGFLSQFAMTQADLNLEPFEKNPALSPLVNAFVGGTLVFVLPENVKPLGYGMVGASGSDGANALVNGLSRIEIQGDEIQGDLQDNAQLVEDMEQENEAVKETLANIEEAELVGDDDATV